MAGHEAARLGSQLAASQRQRRSKEAGNIVEPRARSYDHQRQEKPEKGKCVLMCKLPISVSRFSEVSVKDVADKRVTFGRNVILTVDLYLLYTYVRAYAYIHMDIRNV